VVGSRPVIPPVAGPVWPGGSHAFARSPSVDLIPVFNGAAAVRVGQRMVGGYLDFVEMLDALFGNVTLGNVAGHPVGFVIRCLLFPGPALIDMDLVGSLLP